MRSIALLIVSTFFLAACATTGNRPVPHAPRPSPPAATGYSPKFQPVAPPAPKIPPKDNARATGARAGTDIASLPIKPIDAKAALKAFRTSCPSLVKRKDVSGLTRPSDWQTACTSAATWNDENAKSFFLRHFETVIIGDGNAFATGYYEPEIAASRTKSGEYTIPIYRRPTDLVDLNLGQFSDSLKGKRIRVRIDGDNVLPYHDRAAITDGALSNQGLELAYAADEVAFFILQVQGSGRLRLSDDTVMRIIYDGQNGHPYTGIAKALKENGAGAAVNGGMQGIAAWLRANPDKRRAILNTNRSFVFFKETSGAGAIGALGYPVTGQVSAAVDPAFVPLGAPVWLWTNRVEASGLWVAQDTGGAIKGSNRFDTFWGAGQQAEHIASTMVGKGQAMILLPRGTLARLQTTADKPRTDMAITPPTGPAKEAATDTTDTTTATATVTDNQTGKAADAQAQP